MVCAQSLQWTCCLFGRVINSGHRTLLPIVNLAFLKSGYVLYCRLWRWAVHGHSSSIVQLKHPKSIVHCLWARYWNLSFLFHLVLCFVYLKPWLKFHEVRVWSYSNQDYWRKKFRNGNFLTTTVLDVVFWSFVFLQRLLLKSEPKEL